MRMTGAKSRVGHSEPVAGLVGMANLAAMLGQQGANAIMHLRQVDFQLALAPLHIVGLADALALPGACMARLLSYSLHIANLNLSRRTLADVRSIAGLSW